VTAYALDPKSGTLRPLQTASTLPREFRGSNACAEIKVHPSGKFLYVSNRGHDSIAAFALEDDGRMSWIGSEPTEKTPRSFDLDPTGTYLFAAGESSGKVVAYRVDGEHGRLKRQEVYDVGKRPWWVLAVDLSSPSDRSDEKPGGRASASPVKELILPGESFLVEGRPPSSCSHPRRSA
jgi:6-phosphogluconolactonase